MAGRRRKTLDEQIQLVDESILEEKAKAETYAATSRQKVKSLEEKRRQLVEQKREKEIQDILVLADERGMSVNELRNLVFEKCDTAK